MLGCRTEAKRYREVAFAARGHWKLLQQPLGFFNIPICITSVGVSTSWGTMQGCIPFDIQLFKRGASGASQ